MCSLVECLVRRSDRLIGVNLCHPVFLSMLMETKIDEKNCAGKKRLDYKDPIVKDVGFGR